MNVTFTTASENALIMYFGSAIDPWISSEVQKAYQKLLHAACEDFIEIIPSYASLLVQFNVLTMDFSLARAKIEEIIALKGIAVATKPKKIVIPTYYGTEVGLDLETLSTEKQLSVEEIIDLHVQRLYQVYAIGFAPGFAYLGELDPILKTPRLDAPRRAVPRGSVAIADRQTAVYPKQSPGGWKILGKTPLAMFDATYTGLSLLHVGDSVQFKQITKRSFIRMGGTV